MNLVFQISEDGSEIGIHWVNQVSVMHIISILLTLEIAYNSSSFPFIDRTLAIRIVDKLALLIGK